MLVPFGGGGYRKKCILGRGFKADIKDSHPVSGDISKFNQP